MPTIAPSLVSTRHTVCPHGSFRVACRSSWPRARSSEVLAAANLLAEDVLVVRGMAREGKSERPHEEVPRLRSVRRDEGDSGYGGCPSQFPRGEAHHLGEGHVPVRGRSAEGIGSSARRRGRRIVRTVQGAVLVM